jgi:hypothetical protein
MLVVVLEIESSGPAHSAVVGYISRGLLSVDDLVVGREFPQVWPSQDT